MFFTFKFNDAFTHSRLQLINPLLHYLKCLTDSWGEKSFVVKLILDPRHKIVYVLRGGALNWPFNLTAWIEANRSNTRTDADKTEKKHGRTCDHLLLVVHRPTCTHISHWQTWSDIFLRCKILGSCRKACLFGWKNRRCSPLQWTNGEAISVQRLGGYASDLTRLVNPFVLLDWKRRR